MSPDRRDDDQSEPFPALTPVAEEQSPAFIAESPQQDRTRRKSSITTGPSSPSSPIRSRAGTLRKSLIHSNPPLGAWQAIGQDTSKIPTFPEIRDGSFSSDGWSHEGQLERRNYNPHDIHKRRLSLTRSARRHTDTHAVPEEVKSPETPNNTSSQETQTQSPQASGTPKQKSEKNNLTPVINSTTSQSTRSIPTGPDSTGTYPNGYRFPKKHTWQQSFAIFGKAFWKFFVTPSGFLITIYGLNVVAWGAMIFFLLIPGATPAMCKSYPDCENKTYSARQIWIENTSQILNALFCVTGFGLLPWRARDFYFMIRKQVFHDHDAHRKLAGYYSSWYRLPGSDNLPEDLTPPPAPVKAKKKDKTALDLEQATPAYAKETLDFLFTNPSVPLPPYRLPAPPLTGVRASPTGFQKLAIMIWMYILNTLFQVGLCVVMWGFTKYNRPSWATALFIVLGSASGIVAGVVTFKEGKKVKAAEGVPVRDYDVVESEEDFRGRMEKIEKKVERKHAREVKRQGDVVGEKAER